MAKKKPNPRPTYKSDEIYYIEEPAVIDTTIRGHYLCRTCEAKDVSQEKMLAKCKCRTSMMTFIFN